MKHWFFGMALLFWSTLGYAQSALDEWIAQHQLSSPMDQWIVNELPKRVMPVEAPVSRSKTIEAVSDSEIRCLMRNLYHEAYGEGRLGMLAVGYVTLNRMRSRQYPNTVCGVVYAPHQFSWTRTSKRHVGIPARVESELRELAVSILNRVAHNPIGNAMSFHATYVNPSWSRRLKRVGRIGNHVFYAH